MMSKNNQQVRVEAERIFLRHPRIEDAEEFIALSLESFEFHRGLVNPPRSIEAFHEYVSKNESKANECFLICLIETEEILGAINLSQIFHGGFKNAYLGYYLFANAAGQGSATEAVNSIVGHAFTELDLHRLEANVQPHNESSKRLVERCGFTKEGFSRRYLHIDGDWRDHERWAIIKEDLEENK